MGNALPFSSYDSFSATTEIIVNFSVLRYTYLIKAFQKIILFSLWSICPSFSQCTQI